MSPAQEKMKAELDATEFRDLSVPLVNNWQAREVRTAAEAREGLYHQIPNPVRWTETMRVLSSLGVTRVIEAGAGAVLTGLARQIEGMEAVKFGEAGDWERVLAANERESLIL
jgi:[acyl-carrier-protein] S-malonyltransferase